MSVMEIVLIILGAIVFVGSFLLPGDKKQSAEEADRINEEAIREIVDKEVEEAKSQISDIVDETITYAMEKTERSMERLTNEKMLAVGEYSDTILEQINKNHKEAVFLYDMLNDKHETLVNTVSEAQKTASEVKQTVKDAEVTAREAEETVREAQERITQAEFKPIEPERVEVIYQPPVPEPETVIQGQEEEPKPEPASEPSQNSGNPKKQRRKKAVSESRGKATDTNAEVPDVTVSLNAVGHTGGRNNNERILELHKAGKSNMAIAKELGLGIGEVKLVIDLFEGI